MPKPDEKPPKPDEKPPKPSDKDKEKNKEKIKKAKHLETVAISATGTITAGSWVAEMDEAHIRKNTLRTGQ